MVGTNQPHLVATLCWSRSAQLIFCQVEKHAEFFVFFGRLHPSPSLDKVTIGIGEKNG